VSVVGLRGTFPDALLIRMAVTAMISVAIDVGRARAADPAAYPMFPLDQAALEAHLTRKLLGDLVEFGLMPDGWECEFTKEGFE
jgi:hypothetical protein